MAEPRAGPQGFTEQESVSYGELIRGNRNFRLLWYGQIVSLLGDWFNLIASASLIALLGGSGLALGALFVVRMLAPFLVSPLAGVVADRRDRKLILIYTDLGRAVVVLGFLLVRDPEQLWLLYALTALQLGFRGFFYPARTAILPDVVSTRQLGAANALASATWSVMLALGAALGGLVSGTIGIYPAFVLDSLTFLLSAAFILQVDLERTEGVSHLEKPSAGGLQLYREGLAYLADRPTVLVTALHKAFVALFVSSAFQVVQVTIAEEVFPIGQAGGVTLGLIFATAGVGTGLGPILSRRFTEDLRHRLQRAILVGYLFCAVGLFLTAPLWSLEWVLLGTLLRGTGGGMVWVFSTQLLFQTADRRMHGRVFGTEFAIFTLSGAIASLAAGLAIDSPLRLSGTAYLLGALTFGPMLFWAWWLRRKPERD